MTVSQHKLRLFLQLCDAAFTKTESSLELNKVNVASLLNVQTWASCFTFLNFNFLLCISVALILAKSPEVRYADEHSCGSAIDTNDIIFFILFFFPSLISIFSPLIFFLWHGRVKLKSKLHVWLHFVITFLTLETLLCHLNPFSYIINKGYPGIICIMVIYSRYSINVGPLLFFF